MKELAATILLGMLLGAVIALFAGMLLVIGHKARKVFARYKNKG